MYRNISSPSRPASQALMTPDEVLALEQPDQQLEALLRALDRLEVEVLRNHGQVREGPLAPLHLDSLGRDELKQMTDRRREHVIAAFVVVAVTREASQRTGDVVRHRRLLSDDEFFRHDEAKTARTGQLPLRPARREAQNDKWNRKARQETIAHRASGLAARAISALAACGRRESARREPARRHCRDASTAPSARSPSACRARRTRSASSWPAR